MLSTIFIGNTHPTLISVSRKKTAIHKKTGYHFCAAGFFNNVYYFLIFPIQSTLFYYINKTY